MGVFQEKDKNDWVKNVHYKVAGVRPRCTKVNVERLWKQTVGPDN